MLLDAEERDDTWFRDRVFDCCIVGSGPAGMTLALSLARRGHLIGLFEGGGLERTSLSQDLFVGASIAQDYFALDQCRLRFFGGTSNHWGGMCRELDPYDFKKKPHYNFSGWPIGKGDLDPYKEEAASILDLPTPRIDDEHPSNASDFGLKRVTFIKSRTRFATKFGREIRDSATLRAHINANLVDLRLDDSRNNVTEAHFRSYGREETFVVRSRYFALCLGGLENPRALINCNGQIENGIGNNESMVGRFFCEHLHYAVGQIVFEGSPPLVWSFWAPTNTMMERKAILNFGLRVQPEGAYPPRWMPAPGKCMSPFHVRLAQAMRGESVDCRTVGILRIASEQEATPDSRVILSSSTDRFGWRRIALDWRLSALDFRTIKLATTTFGELIAKYHIGRLKVLDWLLDTSGKFPTTAQDEVGGNHHMCTTRMSDNPRTGVVDANCCVHGMHNLFIGGSSVFSTAGHANPTYTIVQLALRLGDHLHAKLSVSH